MAIPKNKAELIQAIKKDYNNLKVELNTIPETLATEKTLEGHAKNTTMSISNLTAYLIGWGELVIKWEMLHKKGENIIFPETGYKWNQLGLLAQKFYTDYTTLSYIELTIKLDQTVNTILNIIDSYSHSELYSIPWYKQYPMGKMIQLNTTSPYKNARTRIRKWKKQNNLQ